MNEMDKRAKDVAAAQSWRSRFAEPLTPWQEMHKWRRRFYYALAYGVLVSLLSLYLLQHYAR